MEMINLRDLKQSVRRDYPADSIIRQILLSEPDEIPRDEYAIKLTVWLKLIPVKT